MSRQAPWAEHQRKSGDAYFMQNTNKVSKKGTRSLSKRFPLCLSKAIDLNENQFQYLMPYYQFSRPTPPKKHS